MKYSVKTPFETPIRLLVPTYRTVKGNPQKIFPKPEEGDLIFGDFRTYGGTESTENGVYLVYDTGFIDTWYRPDIQAGCRMYIISTGDTYEVTGKPEDIGMRHQFLHIRVKLLGGGA